MSTAWALKIPRDDVGVLGPLRRVEGAEACESDASIWVRGRRSDDALDLRLRAVPGAQRYHVLADGQLIETDARVPWGRLPEGPWRPLHRWLGVTLAQARLGGRIERRIELRLVRSTVERAVSLIETTIDLWHRWAAEAPELRLKSLRFAAAADGRVLVQGEPLPPLPGTRYAVSDGIAVPAGWSWAPAIDATIVRQVLELESNQTVLLRTEGPWEIVDEGSFVRARRSAARQTAGRQTGGRFAHG